MPSLAQRLRLSCLTVDALRERLSETAVSVDELNSAFRERLGAGFPDLAALAEPLP